MAFGGRSAELQLKANNRKLKADLREAQGDVKAFGRKAGDSLKRGFQAALGGLAAFGTAGGIASIGREVFNFEESLTRIGIQAGASDGQLASLRTAVKSTALEFGKSSTEVLNTVSALVDLQGTAGFSEQKMRLLTKASVATGAQLQDLAGVISAMDDSFDLANIEDGERAMSAIISAGKQGKVPLGEMSTVLQQISADFAKISAKGPEGAADLAAAIQVARKGFGSAAEVGTGIKAFVGQLEQNSKKLKRRFKVDVFSVGKDGAKHLKPLREILDQIGKSKLAKDSGLLTEAFGSTEARKFLTLMMANRQQFEEMAAIAKKSDDINTDTAKYVESNAGRMRIALAKVRAEFENVFTPQRMDQIVNIVEKQLVPALEFVLDNAKGIALAFAGIKMAQLVVSTAQWGKSMAGIVSNAGGLGAVLGKSHGNVLGMVGGFLRFAGPIGIAATAAYGLYKAIKSSREESTRLTEEQIKQAELAGKAVGKVTQFDPQGRVDARKKATAAIRKDIEASNRMLYDPQFVQKAEQAGFGKHFGRSGKRAMTEGATQELIQLRQRFISERGNLSKQEFARLEELLRTAELLEKNQKFLGGSLGVKAEGSAQRLEAEAQAINEVERLRFGNPDFDVRGTNLQELAAQRGLEGKQAQDFINTFLRESGGGPRSRFGGGGVVTTGLGVNEQGIVTDTSRSSGLLGMDSPSALLGTIGAGLLAAQEKANAALAERRAVENAKLLEQAMTNALKAISFTVPVSVDGQAVLSATKNTQAARRSVPE